MFLIDQAGQIILHPESIKQQQPLSQLLTPKLSAQLLAAGSNSVVTDEVLLVSTPVSSAGWRVVAQVPITEVLRL